MENRLVSFVVLGEGVGTAGSRGNLSLAWCCLGFMIFGARNFQHGARVKTLPSALIILLYDETLMVRYSPVPVNEV